MQTRARTMTVEEFRAFTDLLENRDKDFELLEGEVMLFPSHKEIQALVIARVAGNLFMFMNSNGIDGLLVASRLDHILGNSNVLRPHAGYTIKSRDRTEEDYPTVAPDLVVEVVQSAYTLYKFHSRMRVFFAHGTRTIWLIYPKTQELWEFRRGENPEKPLITIFLAEDTITGGDVLPGFTAKVSEFFPDLPLADDAL
jgi:Uma2 family endonuclease